jgi:hypothetical protein
MGSNAVRDSAQLALAIYAEALVAHRVVAVLGDASTGLGSLFVELGARSVHVLDPDADRARDAAEQSPRGLVVRPLGHDPVPLRGVDLLVVPDLGLFDDPDGILELVARMASETGVALVAATNRDATPEGSSRTFDYYELFDRVAREFECVRMIAELPFEGVALAEFGQGADEAPAVSVDTQLADENRTPQAFIALASQRDVSLDPYSIVQLVPATPVYRPEAVNDGAVAELEVALAEQTRQLARMSSELEQERAAAEAGRIAALKVQEIERRADVAERSLSALEEELAGRAGAGDEHARLEEALRERAQAVQSLEVELARRDRMVRELVETLDEAAVTAAASAATATDGRQEDIQYEEIARLRDRLDVLALDLARREADARAAGWSIAELERRLAQAAQPSTDPALERQLAGALDELDALRRALVQEHEARLKAESGDELARARAEIQRQSALLEQMAHDLESRRERGEERRDSR